MRYDLSPGQAALSIAYAMAALLCFQAGYRDWRQGPAPKYPLLWLLLALLLLILGFQEATAKLENITQLFREQAKASGWYSHRGAFQEIAVGLVLLAGLSAFAGLFYLVRKAWRRYLPLLGALIYLTGFTAVQGVSLHRIDHLMHTSLAGLLLKNWCALLGIALACFSVVWVASGFFLPWRDPLSSRETEEPPDSTGIK